MTTDMELGRFLSAVCTHYHAMNDEVIIVTVHYSPVISYNRFFRSDWPSNHFHLITEKKYLCIYIPSSR